MKQSLRKDDNIPYTQIANAVLNDKNLSWKAKGLFSYLYSKPQDWDFESSRISEDSIDGRDATRNGIKELEKAGYLKRVKMPNRRMGYFIKFNPSEIIEKPNDGKPVIVNDGNSVGRETRPLSNKELQTNKEETTAEASSAPLKVKSFFDSKQKDGAIPMLANDFILMCRGSDQRHVRIIAEYADDRRPDYQTRGQWREFGLRNMRVARRLTPYTDRQLTEAMGKLSKNLKENGGFISKWSLETLEKHLDEI